MLIVISHDPSTNPARRALEEAIASSAVRTGADVLVVQPAAARPEVLKALAGWRQDADSTVVGADPEDPLIVEEQTPDGP